jgi:hypothetical protein
LNQIVRTVIATRQIWFSDETTIQCAALEQYRGTTDIFKLSDSVANQMPQVLLPFRSALSKTDINEVIGSWLPSFERHMATTKQ